MFVEEIGPFGLEFFCRWKTLQFIDIKGRTTTAATTERRPIKVLLREAFQERSLPNYQTSVQLETLDTANSQQKSYGKIFWKWICF